VTSPRAKAVLPSANSWAVLGGGGTFASFTISA
jgi:hypothetical protein